jgi:hypothetical protein
MVKPRILQTKTQTWHKTGDANYAHIDGISFDVGIRNQPHTGIGAAGFEIEHVRRLRVDARIHGRLQHVDANSFIGFMVDYHTDTGYSKRVALGLGMYSKDRWSPTPIWGANKLPDEYVDLTQRQGNPIDLSKWSPPAWDGRAWFTVLNQNGGANTSVTGRLIIPGFE